MARVLKEEEYNAKRNEILDCALSLIYSKGYAQMTIQDILNKLHISRGALYHYFDSKEALLEALVIRMGAQAAEALQPIMQDPDLSALQKLRRYFEASAQWKAAGKAVILSSLRVWYTDENAPIRQKLTLASMQRTPLILEPVIRQGIEEKVFTTRFPKQAAIILAGVTLTVAESTVALMLSPQADPHTVIQEMEALMAAYFDTVERLLGAPAWSLDVFERGAFSDWLSESQAEPASH
jgi:TetR/AcrR family transcriptional regulator, transcriptional repressor for nem operon